MAYRIYLIHWKKEEVEARAAYLIQAGHSVVSDMPAGRDFLAGLAASVPDVILIDLTRLPSQGRDIGVLIRRQVGTRDVPLVFAGGQEDKVSQVRKVLPDAVYTRWEDILQSLADAIANQPQSPVVPDSAFAAYAGKPLFDKLGIKPGMTVGLINAPYDFSQTLGKLPSKVRLLEGESGECDLLIWFVRSHAELCEQVAKITHSMGDIPLWIAWPKKASGVQTDLAQQTVRDAGLGTGMVDYKVCSIDAIWSGLLFRRRKG